ncbi:MAG: hypothetical protein ETSY2_27815 [Candidatus Entotheonella gemina]|uniref:Uncharacterized protein n=1 Tax=Candidatus Entotheonella gemina TaxID=1429439 RepID=W4M3R7_9BACT|nr:MAG: hypothetical protein ETSY2_27815 [Candidatus Entotheonella gemina]
MRQPLHGIALVDELPEVVYSLINAFAEPPAPIQAAPGQSGKQDG